MMKQNNKSASQINGRQNGNETMAEPTEAQPSNPPAQKNSETAAPSVNDGFRRFAHTTSEIVGKPWSFLLACLLIVVWAFLGPASGFSDTWQLVVNTATTIITFLMVFLIQNTQNRDARAIHLKLDELIRGVKGARNKLINLENLSDEQLAQLQQQFEQLGKAKEASKDRSKPVEN